MKFPSVIDYFAHRKHLDCCSNDTFLNIFIKINSIVVCFLPFLNAYGITNRNIGINDIVSIILVFFYFLFHIKYKGRIFTPYAIFGLLILIQTLILSFVYNRVFSFDFLASYIKLLTSTIFIILCIDFIDLKYLLGTYKILAIFASFGVLLQLFNYYVLGETTILLFHSSFIHIHGVENEIDYLSSIYTMAGLNHIRPGGFFTEPAKFGAYVLPLVCFLLFSKKRKTHDYFVLSILFISIFSCGAMTGIIASGVVFLILAVYKYFLLLKRKNKRNLYLTIGIIATIAFFIIIFLFREKIISMLRIDEIGTSGVSSGSQRVLRGWIIYSLLPLANKLFGTGMTNIAYCIDLYNIKTIYDAGYAGYMNGLSEIFVGAGFFLGCLFILLIVYLFIKSKTIGRVMILVLSLYMITSYFFNTPFYIMFVVIILTMINKKSESVYSNNYFYYNLSI